MIFRSEDASEIACPERSDAEGRTLRCLGARCAAWRWAGYHDTHGFCGKGGNVHDAALRRPDGSRLPEPERGLRLTLLGAAPEAGEF